jgi:pimeloyl-ACP methyl ester carboxylesterase
MLKETSAIKLPVASDTQLEKLPMPVLVLMGEREVLCNPNAALARARRHIADIARDLVPGCSHDMCFSKRRTVDRRVLEFLRGARRLAIDGVARAFSARATPPLTLIG